MLYNELNYMSILKKSSTFSLDYFSLIKNKDVDYLNKDYNTLLEKVQEINLKRTILKKEKKNSFLYYLLYNIS